jgi:hypothetical protein
MAKFTEDFPMAPKPAEWFLYTCNACGGRTFLSPAGGDLNCGCAASGDDVTCTPLYAGKTRTMNSILAVV